MIACAEAQHNWIVGQWLSRVPFLRRFNWRFDIAIDRHLTLESADKGWFFISCTLHTLPSYRPVFLRLDDENTNLGVRRRNLDVRFG